MRSRTSPESSAIRTLTSFHRAEIQNAPWLCAGSSFSFFPVPMTYSFTLTAARISAACLFSCRISAHCSVSKSPTHKNRGKQQETGLKQTGMLSVEHMMLEGVVHQFRIGLHPHLFQNAGPVSADRLDTQKKGFSDLFDGLS